MVPRSHGTVLTFLQRNTEPQLGVWINLVSFWVLGLPFSRNTAPAFTSMLRIVTFCRLKVNWMNRGLEVIINRLKLEDLNWPTNFGALGVGL